MVNRGWEEEREEELRFTLRLNLKAKQMLEEVAQQTGVESIGEVLQNAIIVYLWLYYKAREGKKILVEAERGLEGAIKLYAVEKEKL